MSVNLKNMIKISINIEGIRGQLDLDINKVIIHL